MENIKYIIRRVLWNCYELCYIDYDKETPEGWEQITKAEAIRLCKEELNRRRCDKDFSGIASYSVEPYFYPLGYDIKYDPRYKLVDYVWVKA